MWLKLYSSRIRRLSKNLLSKTKENDSILLNYNYILHNLNQNKYVPSAISIFNTYSIEEKLKFSNQIATVDSIQNSQKIKLDHPNEFSVSNSKISQNSIFNDTKISPFTFFIQFQKLQVKHFSTDNLSIQNSKSEKLNFHGLTWQSVFNRPTFNRLTVNGLNFTHGLRYAHGGEYEDNFETFEEQLANSVFGNNSLFENETNNQSNHFNLRNSEQRDFSRVWNAVRWVPQEGNMVPSLLSFKNDPKNQNILKKSLLVALINRLKQRKHLKHAVEVCSWLIQSKEFDIGGEEYKLLIDCLCRHNRIKMAESFFHNLPKKEKTEEIYQHILFFYSRRGQVNEVKMKVKYLKSILDPMAPPSVLPYNALLFCMGRKKKYEDFDNILNEMIENKVDPLPSSFNIILNFLGKAGMVPAMEQAYQRMQDLNVPTDSVTYNTLIHSYFLSKRNPEAEAWMQVLRDKNIVIPSVYTTAIWAYARQGLTGQMEQVWNEIISLSIPLYRQLFMAKVQGYGNAGMVKEAEEAFAQMVAMGERPVTMTYNSLLSAYTQNKQMKKAEELGMRMEKEGMKRDHISFQYLIHGYLSLCDLASALRQFQTLLLYSDPREATPRFPTFFLLLSSFADVSDVIHGDELFEIGKKLSYRFDTKVYNEMLKMYARSDMVCERKETKERLREKVREKMEEMKNHGHPVDNVTLKVLKYFGLEEAAFGMKIRREFDEKLREMDIEAILKLPLQSSSLSPSPSPLSSSTDDFI